MKTAFLVGFCAMFLLFSLPTSARNCTEKDYVQQILPCDVKSRTRSVVYYLNSKCTGGTYPPHPKHGIPCDCPPGKGLTGDLLTDQKCEACNKGTYGSGGEVINNWRDWTKNGTTPPEGSDLVTYCETSRDYVRYCEAWKASADNFTLYSGDNSLTRCMVSVLLITRNFVMNESKVSFDYRVDSRDCSRPGYLGCDGLGFFIDSKQVLDYAGNQFQWKTKTYSLTKGTHTLKWIFRKRCFSYGFTYMDKAFIRSISLIGNLEPNVTCKRCPPGYFGDKEGSSNCTACSYFQYQDKEGQQKCETCPPNTYAMLGASKCLPLPNCTDDDVIIAPGDLSTCSCKPSPLNNTCTTTIQPRFVAVKGFNLKDPRVLCNPNFLKPLPKTKTLPCRCQPGFEISKAGGNLQCKACEKGYFSEGVKCERCSPGHVALPGKHYYVWRNNTLPEGFTAQCSGDCSIKTGWISAGDVIRSERVVGNVHAELQSPEIEVDSELAKIIFNCSVHCNLTGISPRTARGEHLANIKDCNLIFQVWSNNSVRDQVNCTHPKGSYSYKHERKRDGQILTHVYPLKKGTYFFRWVFHQQDETRVFSTAFEARVFNISILGAKSGEARNCTACPAGYHSISGNTDCTICPNGTASSPGAKNCTPCQGETFAASMGSETCLPCGSETKAFPGKDGCVTNGCKFTPAPDVEYDLNMLSRPGGSMIKVLFYQPGSPPRSRSRRRSPIWPFRPSIYVNLCTVNHDNSSCTSRVRGKRQPLPVMACRSSWYGSRDMDIGSVIGYKAKKDDVRSGLFVELLHGGKCYSEKNGRYRTILDLRCDVRAGVGFPGPETNYTNILRKCKYYFVWKSLYACPKCRDQEVSQVKGECINGTRNITLFRSVPCWGNGAYTDFNVTTEQCVVPTTPCPKCRKEDVIQVKGECINGTRNITFVRSVPCCGSGANPDTNVTTEECVEPSVVTYIEKQTNKLNKILIGVGVVVIVVLLGVAMLFVYKHRTMKYRYFTSMARNKPMSRLAQEDDERNFMEDDELSGTYNNTTMPVKM